MRMTRAVESQKGKREEESWLKRGQDIGQLRRPGGSSKWRGVAIIILRGDLLRVCVEKLAWTVIK
jgi:hypothetical protein